MKYLLLILSVLLISWHCQTKPRNSAGTPLHGQTLFDTVVQQLKTNSELLNKDLLALRLVDTTNFFSLGETGYCDTTVQLNDSVFYSIVDLGDKMGVCAYTFIVTLDEKNKKGIASKHIESDCDIDFSRDSYELFEHTILSRHSIVLTRTTVYQKKNRVHGEEEKNIDHKTIQTSYLLISPEGQINTVER